MQSTALTTNLLAGAEPADYGVRVSLGEGVSFHSGIASIQRPAPWAVGHTRPVVAIQSVACSVLVQLIFAAAALIPPEMNGDTWDLSSQENPLSFFARIFGIALLINAATSMITAWRLSKVLEGRHREVGQDSIDQLMTTDPVMHHFQLFSRLAILTAVVGTIVNSINYLNDNCASSYNWLLHLECAAMFGFTKPAFRGPSCPVPCGDYPVAGQPEYVARMRSR